MRKLEFRYQGGGMWMANVRPHDNVPYIAFVIDKTGLFEDESGVYREFQVHAHLLHRHEHDPRNGRYRTADGNDTVLAHSYEDAVNIANQLLQAIEDDYAKQTATVTPIPKPKKSRKNRK